MNYKDLFLSFNEWSPSTMLEIYINHERILIKAGEAALEYGKSLVLSFNSKTVYLEGGF